MADNAQVVPVEEPTTTTTTTATTETTTTTTTEPEPEPKSSDKMESQSDKPRVGMLVTIVNIIAAGVLPIFTFILSLTLLGYAVWLLYIRSYACEDILGLPRVQTLASVGLLAVFVVSNAALFLRRKFPMPALVVMVVILLLMLFIGLAYAGVNEMQSRRFPATRTWFKMKVTDDIVNWNNIKSCIYDKGACNDLVYGSPHDKPYDRKKMPPIKNGCCMPPETCNMDSLNATFWYKRKDEGPPLETPVLYGRYGGGGMLGWISDCELWRNDWSVLCYDCRSCKHGFVRSVRKKWWQLGIFLIVISILLLISHLLIFLSTFWERFYKSL